MKNLHLRIGATVVIVLAALVLSLSIFQTTTSGIKIAAAIATPTPKPFNNKKKSPKEQNAISACILENMEQDGGMAFQGISGTPSGPLCTKKWSFSFLGNPYPKAYEKLFPGKCYTNVDMNFVCYWSTPQEACKAKGDELKQITPNITWGKGTLTPTNDPERFDCTFRDRKSPQWPQTTTIELRDRKPEGHCKDEVAGPYQNFSDYSACGKLGKPGGYYTDTQRGTIKAANKANNIDPINNPNGLFFKSDAAGWEYTKPEKKNCNKKSLVAGKCIEVEYLKGTNGGEDLPQIDHILPRRDRSGCNCGSNTMKNAALISAQLNRALSNDPLTVEQHAWYKEGKAYPTPAP